MRRRPVTPSLLTPTPGFPSRIARISCRLHFFRTCRLQSGRLQSGSSIRCRDLGCLVGCLFGFRGRPFLSFRTPLFLQSSLPRFMLFPPRCHHRFVSWRHRLELVEGLLLGLSGRCDTVLKRGVFERSQGLLLKDEAWTASVRQAACCQDVPAASARRTSVKRHYWSQF